MITKQVLRLSNEADATVVIRTHLEYFQDHFIGVRMSENWVPPYLMIHNKSKPLKDFVSFQSTAPVMSERAVQVLSPLIADTCELLPIVQINEVKYFAVNTLLVVDCVDWDSSQYHRVPGAPHGGVMICEYRFAESRVPEDPLFKVAPDSPVFVRPNFVSAVAASGLTNALFLDPSVDPLAPK